MGRISVMLGLTILGFVIGFLAFIAFGFLGEIIIGLIPYLLTIDGLIIRAFLSGLVGSVITIYTGILLKLNSNSDIHFSLQIAIVIILFITYLCLILNRFSILLTNLQYKWRYIFSILAGNCIIILFMYFKK